MKNPKNRWQTNNKNQIKMNECPIFQTTNDKQGIK